MNEQEKKMAVDIFDYFFKKAGIASIKLFCFKDVFVLDVSDAQDEWHTVYGNFLDVMYFIVPKDYHSIICSNSYNVNSIICSNSYNVKTMKLDDVLKEIKETVIINCINGNALSINFFKHFKMLVPAAKSLEELAIKMELES